MKTNKGFSLVELIIVMVIIGIALAIASPSFYKYRQNTALKEATRELAGDISLYRQTSIAQNVRYRINFNPSGSIYDSYTVQVESPANSGLYVDVLTKSPSSINGSIIIMGDINSPSFTGGVPYITIQPRGTMSAGTIWMQHLARQSTSTITTNLMGRVNVTYDLKY